MVSARTFAFHRPYLSSWRTTPRCRFHEWTFFPSNALIVQLDLCRPWRGWMLCLGRPELEWSILWPCRLLDARRTLLLSRGLDDSLRTNVSTIHTPLRDLLWCLQIRSFPVQSVKSLVSCIWPANETQTVRICGHIWTYYSVQLHSRIGAYRRRLIGGKSFAQRIPCTINTASSWSSSERPSMDSFQLWGLSMANTLSLLICQCISVSCYWNGI